MKKYQKRDNEVEALQYGPYSAPTVEMHLWISTDVDIMYNEDGLYLYTTDGLKIAHVGDWIVKTSSGCHEIYSNDMFHEIFIEK